MEETASFSIAGLIFDWPAVISITFAMAVVFFVLLWLSHKVTLKPTKKQNALEMIIEFTNGIVEGSLPNKTGNDLKFYAFMLFMFVFVSNQIGLFLHVGYDGVTYLKSATADPLVAFTLALISVGLSHFLSVSKLGFKGYIKSVYLSPYPALLPINLIDQFTSFMTLGLRLFGNIFAGEMLLALLWEFASSAGLVTLVPGMFMTIIWVGFSLFIGAIQAYVFVTLTSVYVAEKMEA